jgi:hypothetical protein
MSEPPKNPTKEQVMFNLDRILLQLNEDFEGDGYSPDALWLEEVRHLVRQEEAEVARLREDLAERFTIDEIADYIGGWAIGCFDEVQKLGQQVSGNALQQLRHEEDGIAAARSRKQALAAVREKEGA